jgi:plastocyanin
MKALIRSKSRDLTIITIFLAVLSISYGCNKATNPQITPGANEVVIQGNAFNPGTITITANTSIKWINNDGVPHTVTSNGGLFDSGTISPNGGTWSHLFPLAGTFQYHCAVHTFMTASVTVN